MSKVVIEGSLTPCTGWPAAGKRKTVELTPEVHRAVRSGCIKIVASDTGVLVSPPRELSPEEEAERRDRVTATANDGGADDSGQGDEVEPSDPAPLEKPHKNEKREVWAAYLASKGIPFTDDDGQRELIAIAEKAEAAAAAAEQ